MPNRLAASQSPYLRQHAENPVDWYEWGEEAFARARREQKPIFLSIGYSTCHWCHVMAHESFEQPEIAALLNAHFVAIKLDREERPDVDRVYMTYVQAMTGHGGWPLSAWLTPELQPFYGGTYFPPQDRGGRAGFATLLRVIGEGWQKPDQRAKMIAEGQRAIETLRDHAASRHATTETASPPAAPDWFERAQKAFEGGYQFFYEHFDAEDGGFGGAPKFPRASVLTFLIRCAAIQGPASESGQEALAMVSHTLRRMAQGGLHDHVGGGFHRYSVDERWFVPHFEKMLYDQAQIALNFLEGFEATGDARFAWVVRDIFAYLLRDLRHPEGGFYSAEDADSRRSHDAPDHAEGAFYVWTPEEIAAAVGPVDAPLVCAHFGVRDDGNVPPELDPHHEFTGKNILAQKKPLTATAQALQLDPEDASRRLVAALDRLRAHRSRRPRPHLDDKVIAAWNGLALSALARAHVTLERSASADPECHVIRDNPSGLLAAAVAAARFVRARLFDETTGRLHRTFGSARSPTEGFAEDYSCVIAGLLDLYEATFDPRWLEWADSLQETQDALFWDDAEGGYFSASASDPHLVLRLKEDYDGAESSPNSVSAVNLLRFAALFHDEARRERALRLLEALRPQWTQAPQALPHLITALELVVEPARQIVLVGETDTAEFQALAAALPTGLGPRRVVLAISPSTPDAWLLRRAPWLAAMTPVAGSAAAYVCERFTCQAPVTTPDALRALLSS